MLEKLPRWVEQWRLHQETLQGSGKETWYPHEVGQAIRPLRALVLGPADHFPNSLFIACPVHYHKLLCKTFGDPAVFQSCRNGAARIIQHSRQDFENQHPDLQVYSCISVAQRTAECQNPTKRIQTVRQDETDHRLHKVLAH